MTDQPAVQDVKPEPVTTTVLTMVRDGPTALSFRPEPPPEGERGSDHIFVIDPAVDEAMGNPATLTLTLQA